MEDKTVEFIGKVKELCKEYEFKNVIIGFDSETSFHGHYALETERMTIQQMSLCLVSAGRLFQGLREKFLQATNMYKI